MSPDAWICLAVTLAVFLGLQRRGAPADLLFLAGLSTVTLFGVISPKEALSGFANPAVITIGALFVVAAGLRSTGALDLIGRRVLGRAGTSQSALARLAAPVVGLSAFMNNTPIVAMLVPVVVDWCRRHGVSPSRLLIPISYLAIMGGTCTLIGTSTNLVISGMLSQERDQLSQDRDQRLAAPGEPNEAQANQHPVFKHDAATRRALRGMHLFEIGYVGLPCAILGALYLLVVGHRLLPNRTELIEQLGEQRREYLVEMLVQAECRLIGQTVEQAGLRQLPGLFLIEIDRDGEIITPITPEDIIHAGDRLIFTGVVTTIADLDKIPGLTPATDMTYDMNPAQRHGRRLTEVVLSDSSPLIGTTVRDAKFRQLYNAAVVAVHRNGKRLPKKIGDIELQPGDTLLLQTRTEFVDAFRHSRDFYLVASLEGSQARRHDRAWLAMLWLVLLVVLFTTFTMTGLSPAADGVSNPGLIALAAIIVAGLMVASRCLSPADARAAIDIQVLVTISAALGLGLALDRSGAAGSLASVLVGVAGESTAHPYVLLAVVYLLTLVFTEMITNTAVAALMFPLAVAVATQSDLSPRPFVMAVAIAASCSFITPIGYQTNLMVMGPGGYQPRDYLKAGAPLSLIVMITALVLIPIFWPFALP